LQHLQKQVHCFFKTETRTQLNDNASRSRAFRRER
jgi:hypothetical protein